MSDTRRATEDDNTFPDSLVHCGNPACPDCFPEVEETCGKCDNDGCYVCHPKCTGSYTCTADDHVAGCFSILAKESWVDTQEDEVPEQPSNDDVRFLGKCAECGFITALWIRPEITDRMELWEHRSSCSALREPPPYRTCPECQLFERVAAVSSNGRTHICSKGHAWTILA